MRISADQVSNPFARSISTNGFLTQPRLDTVLTQFGDFAPSNLLFSGPYQDLLDEVAKRLKQ